MDQNNRTRFGWEDSDSEQEQQTELFATSLLPGEPCAGTSQEAHTDLSASYQQTGDTTIGNNNELICMICLGNTFEDLAFRTTVYNTVRNINDTPPPPPPNEYSNEDAVVESGLCDIFGHSFTDSRGTLITPFQCLDWGQPRSLAHHFHMGCIGTYAWKC